MFNRALDLVRKGEKVSKKLRTKLITKKSVKKGEEWLKKIPNCVKQGGVIQLINTFRTNFAKKRITNEHKFKKQKEMFDRSNGL